MKAIYMPKGKAGEYAKYACNFYKGCSNGCEYCYLKKGVLAHALGGDKPLLKSCFKNRQDAIQKFLEDLIEKGGEVNADIKKHGIFFTFTSDPCLPETIDLNFSAIYQALQLEVPIQILTKRTEWIDATLGKHLLNHSNAKKLLSVGFTLTGHDELEPNAAPHVDRIKSMKRIHSMGIRTWASVEPMIDIEAGRRCIKDALYCCDEFKIGLLSGGKHDYTKEELLKFFRWTEVSIFNVGAKVYWKESVRKFIGKEEQR